MAINKEYMKRVYTVNKINADKEYEEMITEYGKFNSGNTLKVPIQYLEPDVRKNLIERFVKRIVVDKERKPQFFWRDLANITSCFHGSRLLGTECSSANRGFKA